MTTVTYLFQQSFGIQHQLWFNVEETFFSCVCGKIMFGTDPSISFSFVLTIKLLSLVRCKWQQQRKRTFLRRSFLWGFIIWVLSFYTVANPPNISNEKPPKRSCRKTALVRWKCPEQQKELKRPTQTCFLLLSSWSWNYINVHSMEIKPRTLYCHNAIMWFLPFFKEMTAFDCNDAENNVNRADWK